LENKKNRAILVGIRLYTDKTDLAQRSIDELERLAHTAGLEVVATVIQQKDRPDNASYIGRGKCDELREFCENNDIDVAVFDDELSGSQMKNIETIMDVAVLDRTLLVLDIFASRARSAEGRLQVELAQLQYRLPRLSGMGASLSRLGGGIGTRGPGETKLETDKRHINRRIKAIKEKLADVSKRREQTRSRRKKDGLPTVALVGYTNAGKSTLLNKLCGSDIYAEDQLFATLDTSVRKMKPTSEDRLPAEIEILFIDTVGFIRKLPHSLVDAFKSTLEESINADLILNVVDASDPEADEHIRVTDEILASLGADAKPSFLVLNKADRLDSALSSPSFEIEHYTKASGTPVYYVSAVSGKGITELKRACFEFFKRINKIY